MTVKLYHCHETRSMRTLWLLNELGIPFDLETMPFDHKYLRSKEYLGIHPLGRIPAIVDGDLTLYESGAIAEYLVERYDSKGTLGRPVGNPERYEWLKWIHFAETVIIPCQNMVQQYVFIPKEQRSEIVVYFEVRRLGKVLDAIESVLADGREFLLKSGFSAADCGVGFSLYFATAFAILDEHPRVKAYLERVMARPAFKKSQPENPLAWLKPLLGPIRNPNTGKVLEAA